MQQKLVAWCHELLFQEPWSCSVVRGTPCSLAAPEIDEPFNTALIAPVMDSSDHCILLSALLAFPGLDPFWLSFSLQDISKV